MIGISSLAFMDKSLDEALECIESMVSCAEIFSESSHWLDQNVSSLFSYDLKYSIHAPTLDVNIASLREKTRQASLDIIAETAQICASADARVLVVHPGYVSDTGVLDKAYAALDESLRFLSRISEDTGVRICIENMPDHETYLFRHPNEISLQSNGFVLDTGHAHLNNNLSEFLKTDIDHFHIHDNNAISDEHLAVGDGTIDFSELIPYIRSSKATLVIENKSPEDAEKSLHVLKSFL